MLLLLMLVGICLPEWLQAQTSFFQGLSGQANALSDNGQTIVGYKNFDEGNWMYHEAYMWNQHSEMRLGKLPSNIPNSTSSHAQAISGNGAVVVGIASHDLMGEAFVWQNGTIQGLGMLNGGTFSVASSASYDGSVISGHSRNGNQNDRLEAFRWENGVMKGMGVLNNGSRSLSFDMSSNGAIIVGSAKNGAINDRNEAYIWENDVMQPLGILAGGTESSAYALSQDGQVVVGWADNSLGVNMPVRWQNSIIQSLGSLGDGNSYANDVSHDGSVIVGSSDGVAFIWDQLNGIQNLNDVLVSDYQLDLTGWTLTSVVGITPDGTTMVGRGINPSGQQEGWIAHIPEPATLMLLSLGAFVASRRKQP